jgi:RNA polymerase sigma-70 factor (ECF subfamily)
LPTDDDLLQRARTLEPAALGAIFDRYYDALYRYAYRHIGHQTAAQDVAAACFERLLRALHAGGGPTEHLRAWLYRTAHNLIIDDARKQQHRQHNPLHDGMAAHTTPVEQAVTTSEQFQQAQAALAHLTDDQRAVVVLKHLHGLPNAEIAAVLGVSVGAVKAREQRGLAALRAHLRFEEGKHP